MTTLNNISRYYYTYFPIFLKSEDISNTIITSDLIVFNLTGSDTEKTLQQR